MFAAWNESPTPDWLLLHGFTHVIKFKTKDGGAVDFWSVNAKPK
jgi:hypothetical protein